MEEYKVQCLMCNKIMSADEFSDHAISCHKDDVLDLLSDDDIIEGLSEWVK